ncbi:unnamed protein product [Rotaria sp. Silwood2]|nr:unnamed protein product [Rotaria sp. Silwood2]CAF4652877.1 unnamed protein product [Rotaria sp. Silwood2]CAF4775129.1 unnamed protein product [Rotaria sp. Silwood2]
MRKNKKVHAFYGPHCETDHFSYVAFDRINKQRVKKEAQWKKRRGQLILGDEVTDNDEDKNDDTIEDYHSGAY